MVIWLNGGPGCSSMDGALMEIGPYRLKDNHTLRYNDGSWDEFTNILFIDNPVGTGYSYVNTDSYVHELTEMAKQLVIFLEKFFALFPEYEDDDVCSCATQSNSELTGVALHCRRIVCWAAYSSPDQSNTRSQPKSSEWKELECVWLTDRQWLDLALRTIRFLRQDGLQSWHY